MIKTPNLGLIVWNLSTDPYDSGQLAGNFQKLDDHDHSFGKGQQIPTGGIQDGAITQSKIGAGVSLPTATIPDGSITSSKFAAGAVNAAAIASGAVKTAAIAGGAVQAVDLADAARLGLSDGAIVRRGKTNIVTTESTGATTYAITNLATPDRVQSVVLPTDGRIVVGYQATWQESSAGVARAAIFIGANQLKLAGFLQAAGTGPTSGGNNTAATNRPLFTHTGGLGANSTWSTTINIGATGLGTATVAGAYPGNATTGQAIGGHALDATNDLLYQEVGGGLFPISGLVGGLCYIFASAGTYDISVQFKVSSGSVTVRDRHLWVETVGY